MGDSRGLFRAPHTSVHVLAKDWRRRPGRPSHTWLRTLEADLQPLTQRGDMPKIDDDGGSSWKRLRSSPGRARDDDDDDESRVWPRNDQHLETPLIMLNFGPFGRIENVN